MWIGIIQAVVHEGNQTRAVLRLPDGSRARFAISVADLDGNIVGLYRMPDSTMFSVDVAVAKSRNVIYFSGGSSYGCLTPPICRRACTDSSYESDDRIRRTAVLPARHQYTPAWSVFRSVPI